jgi:hypothetical protein
VVGWSSLVLIGGGEARCTRLFHHLPDKLLIYCPFPFLPHTAYEGDEATLNAIVILLGSLAANEDMCIAIETGNVFPPILKIFKKFPQNRVR